MSFKSGFRKTLCSLIVVGLLLSLALACAAPAGEKATVAPTTKAAPTEAAAKPAEATSTPKPVEKPVSAPAAGEPKRGGILRSALKTSPPIWGPDKSMSGPCHYPLSLIYSKLTSTRMASDVDPGDQSPIGDLAESWEIPNDRTYIFHLNKGVKWQNKEPVNGRELVAEDIKFTIEHIRASKAGLAPMYELATKIECPDKYTVKITLNEPFAPFLTYCGGNFFHVVAREVEEKYGDYDKWNTTVGTGPFMLTEYVPDSKLTYVRNPDYYKKGLPYLDGITVLIVADGSTRLAALRSGQLHQPLIDTVNVERTDIPMLKKTNPELVYFDYIRAGQPLIFYRTDLKPFNDVRVRRAVSLALDRKKWLDSMFLGVGVDQSGPCTAAYTDWWLPTDKLGDAAQWLKYDPELAKKLLAEAGYPNGFDTILATTTGYGVSHVEQAELINDFLNKVGIRTKMKLIEYAAYQSTYSLGKYEEGLYFGLSSAHPEVDGFFYNEFKPGQVKNWSYVKDPKVDEMVEKQRRAVDVKERKKIIDELTKYVWDQMYYVYTPFGAEACVWSPKLKNFRPKADYNLGRRYEVVWFEQ